MAHYEIYNPGTNWAISLRNPATSGAELLYVNATEIGYLCADGTYVYLEGIDFTYVMNPDGSASLTGGNVTAVHHYTADGHIIGAVTGVDPGVSTSEFTFYAKQDGPLSITRFETAIMAGDDILDARIRAGGTVINDTLSGWGGNDSVFSGAGKDLMSGDQGDDIARAGGGNDRVAGGQGDDALYGNAGQDLLAGGQGNDMLRGGLGRDTAFFLGKFSDLTIMKIAGGFTVVSGEIGTDNLFGIERIATNDGVYQFDSATQLWTKVGGANQALMLTDTLATEYGTAGNDSFKAQIMMIDQPSLDLIFGGTGDDHYEFKTGFGPMQINNDHGLLYGYGGDGNDTFDVRFSSDYLLNLPSGTFRFFGEAGDDILNGGVQNDELDGGAGADRIAGGNGNDMLTGGEGADIFSFTNFYPPGQRSLVANSGNDVITDFEIGVDSLVFSNTGVAAFALTDTSEGLLLTAAIASGPGITVTVLLQGLHGSYAVDDILNA